MNYDTCLSLLVKYCVPDILELPILVKEEAFEIIKDKSCF